MRSVTSGILSGCSDLAGRRCGFRAPCGLFHTPAAVEPCRKTAKKRENGLCISKTAYHAACFSTRFSTGCGKVLPSCVGNGKENVGLRRGGLPRLAAVVPGGGAWRFWLPVDSAAVVPEGVVCLLCRLPTLPSVYFSAPYPPDPLPRRGRGRFFCFLMQGASPLASPGLNLRFAAKPTEFLYLERCRQPRRGGTGGDGTIRRTRRRRLRWSSPPGQIEQVPRGACFLCCLPTLPSVYFFCPLFPRPPSPVGKGEPKVISCKGLRPLHPRG